jgi:GNAT superfamily N-acetyltransferase
VAAAFEHYIERIGRPPMPMLLDFPAAIGAQQVWVADMDGDVVGVLVIYPTGEGFYIDTVAVSPPLQGTGVGKLLLQFAEREALQRGFDSIYLCTHVKMTENQRLYPKIGYVETERKVDQGFARVFYRKRLVGS